MKEFVKNFQKNKTIILKQLLKKLKNENLENIESKNLDEVFLHFNALETIYAVDNNYLQVSPTFNRNSQNDYSIGNETKQNLKENIDFNTKEYFISSPYISRKTNKYVITLVKKLGDRILALDFDLLRLLNEFNNTNLKPNVFTNIVKIIYGIIGVSLTMFAMILVFYAIYDFYNSLYESSSNIFHSIFKSTIALTLGLAIFDLAKNLLEHEVIFKENNNKDHGGNKLLIKFMISIIIALAIESLMMVFKIAISNYKDIVYAVYLLFGIGFLLITMSQYNKYLNSNLNKN